MGGAEADDFYVDEAGFMGGGATVMFGDGFLAFWENQPEHCAGNERTKRAKAGQWFGVVGQK